MPTYNYRFVCSECDEKLEWSDHYIEDWFVIEPCATCLAAQPTAAEPKCQVCGDDDEVKLLCSNCR